MRRLSACILHVVVGTELSNESDISCFGDRDRGKKTPDRKPCHSDVVIRFLLWVRSTSSVITGSESIHCGYATAIRSDSLMWKGVDSFYSLRTKCNSPGAYRWFIQNRYLKANSRAIATLCEQCVLHVMMRIRQLQRGSEFDRTWVGQQNWLLPRLRSVIFRWTTATKEFTVYSFLHQKLNSGTMTLG